MLVYYTVEIALRQNTYSVYLGHFSSLFFAKLRALDDLKTASNIEKTTQAITEISSSVFCEKKTFKEPIHLLNMGLILLSTTPFKVETLLEGHKT